jgi:phenylalanyl-tRNA synthetase beta chain
MIFSRNWLAEYVNLPDDHRDLARRLTLAGLAVEGLEEKGDDVLLDVEVTTNRPDAMNHLGLAREIAVLFRRALRRPRADPREAAEGVESAADVVVEEEIFCPRYVARVVRGVRVGPSPEWLRDRLLSIGLRPVNNVVDVTNFVLWEMGQPLHAFDLDRLAGRRIVVRLARGGERLVTLDGVERELDEKMLVIADAERPVALAGVLGGLDSEVTEETRDVLLESAHFHRVAVRSTARRLGLHTDASHRFERGADPEACDWAAGRAARLLAEVAGGTVLAGAIDRRAPQVTGWPARGRLSLARLNAFAGLEIAREEVERSLTALGFEVEPVDAADAADGADGAEWEVAVPSWRTYDFQTRNAPPHGVYAQDLYEEVLRIHGFDDIPATLPGLPGSDAPRTEAQVRRQRLRRHLAACGFAEAVNFAFHDRASDERYPSLRPGTRPLALANPISEAYGVLRRSLLPSLVASARFNQRRGGPAVRLFEVATVFYERDGETPEERLPDQPEHLGIVCGGRLGSPWEREEELDFFDLKGVVESLADAFGVELALRPAELPGFAPGSSAEVVRADRPGEVVGLLGRLEEDEVYPLYAAELAVEALAGGSHGLEVAIPSRFPGVSVDLTFTHALATPWAEVDRAIAEATPPDLVSWGLKDRYQGQGVPEGAVNTTISFLYNAGDRSLTLDEVNERQGALAAELKRRFGGGAA